MIDRFPQPHVTELEGEKLRFVMDSVAGNSRKTCVSVPSEA